MLPDVNSLLDKVVEVLWDLGSEAISVQDSENFCSSDPLDLWDSIAISESDADL